MSSKIGLNLTTNYSINFDLKKEKKKIKFIIIHYTGMKKEIDAIKRFVILNQKLALIILLRKMEKSLNLVPDLYKAWHAGKSYWKKF